MLTALADAPLLEADQSNAPDHEYNAEQYSLTQYLLAEEHAYEKGE